MDVPLSEILSMAGDMPRDVLLEQIKRLIQELERRQGELERQQAEIDSLRKENERLLKEKGKGVRQRSVRKAQPKEAKAGSGPVRRRSAPAASASDTIKDVPVVEAQCPHCGGDFDDGTWEEATVTDLPKAPAPVVTRFRVQTKTCQVCGRKVRGHHPELPADQHGATAHRLGDRASATAQTLHYGYGIPQRKIPLIFKHVFNLEVTQGALVYDSARRAAQLEHDYDLLRAQIQARPVVHTDDTGWRVGGHRAQLMVFTTPDGETFYQIRLQHRNEEVREVIPSDWPGVMVTDRGRSYDARELLGIKQHKCSYHVLSSIEVVLETKEGEDRFFGVALKNLTQQAVGLWNSRQRHEVTDHAYCQQAEQLRKQIAEHLRERDLGDDDNDRLRRELHKHNDRGNLFRFLDNPEVHPTNNLSEREIRSAVIARKVSQCSKSWEGAHRREVLQSIIRTELRTKPSDIIESMTEKFRLAKIAALSQPSRP